MKNATRGLVALTAAGITLPVLAQPESDDFSKTTFSSRGNPTLATEGAEIRLAQSTTAPSAASESNRGVSDATPSAHAWVNLEEVVVTAQKRVERLQDVPLAVTAVQADALVFSNQVEIQDYFTKVPGFYVSPGAQSFSTLSIRGVTTLDSNPTVGVVVDEVPFGSTIYFGGGNILPDIDPSDLARIEVLRGPQGALYGTNSMGGILKYVTADPSVEQLSGRAFFGTSSVSDGDDLGYEARASLNVPMSQDLALRVSGFTRKDPGYIDNISTGEEDVNDGQVGGGRFGLLWNPSDALWLKFGAVYQHARQDSESDISDPERLVQTRMRGLTDRTVETQGYYLTTKLGLGRVDLVSITGYNVIDHEDSLDFTAGLLGLVQNPDFLDDPPVTGATGVAEFEAGRAKRFTQELRVTSAISEAVDVMVGGFFSREKNTYKQTFQAGDFLVGTVQPEALLTYSFPTKIRDRAVFANLTARFSDRFNVQVGARESWNDQHFSTLAVGRLTPVFFGAPAPLASAFDSSEKTFTYLVTPQYTFSENVMTYVRVASGFRPGGGNVNALRQEVPAMYEADKIVTYELGTKGSVWDNRLSFDASFYYVDWKDLQLGFTALVGTVPVGFTGNGGKAKSEGFELSIDARPMQGMTVGGWLSVNNAVLAEDVPATADATGSRGDRLPTSAEFSANVYVDQMFALADETSLTVGGSIYHTGDRLGRFKTKSDTRPRFKAPSYEKVDIHATLARLDWKLGLYVDNVFDKRAILSGGTDSYLGTYFITRTRTVGLNVSHDF